CHRSRRNNSRISIICLAYVGAAPERWTSFLTPELLGSVMRYLSLSCFFLLLIGCGQQPEQPKTQLPPGPSGGKLQVPKVSLAEARRGFQTKLIRRESTREPVPGPPADLFRTVHYNSPAGNLAAYVSTPPKDGKKHPAIVWIFGGFDNSIGDTAWHK